MLEGMGLRPDWNGLPTVAAVKAWWSLDRGLWWTEGRKVSGLRVLDSPGLPAAATTEGAENMEEVMTELLLQPLSVPEENRVPPGGTFWHGDWDPADKTDEDSCPLEDCRGSELLVMTGDEPASSSGTG